MKSPNALGVAEADGAPCADKHYVRLFGSDHCGLAKDASQFLASALLAGGAAVMIATREHRTAFLEELSHATDIERATAARQLVALDADETLAQLMVRGYPDPVRFDDVIGSELRELTGRYETVHAFGEMVGCLWAAKQYPAAIRIEQLWGRLRAETPFNLYCGYPIDIFDDAIEQGTVDALLAAHTHLLPARESVALGAAIGRAAQSILGLPLDELERQVGETSRRNKNMKLPIGESTVLWLRTTHPDHADAVLKEARSYSELSA
jgi:hypothetical protein